VTLELLFGLSDSLFVQEIEQWSTMHLLDGVSEHRRHGTVHERRAGGCVDQPNPFERRLGDQAVTIFRFPPGVAVLTPPGQALDNREPVVRGSGFPLGTLAAGKTAGSARALLI
jgi:hypothetical protein